MSTLLIFDAQDRVLKVSDSLLKRLGYEASELRGLVFDTFVVEDSDRFKPDFGVEVRQTGYLKRKNGEIVEALLHCERLDERSELYVLEADFTEEAKSDADGASSPNAESLNFLTTVSHELRVALNGVIGFSNLLGVSSLDVEQQAILEKLQSCNHLLKGLVNDILEYSKVVSSNIDLAAERVRLEAFVNEVAGLFRERARRKDLELRVDIDPSAMRWVAIPKLRVTQVLSNLISNAVKFTSVGWISIRARADENWIYLSVQDTGPGIEAGERELVFQPFMQSRSRRDESEGSGLGLAISRGLVEKMGGALELAKPDEGGSRFDIRLPLQREASVPDIGSPSVDGMESKLGQIDSEDRAKRVRKHILVVEDNQLNADILSHFLQNYGATFDLVDNGRSAVEVYQDGKYDLILMDVMLPEMNGYEATEMILNRSRRKSPVPIIGVTAKVFRRDQVRCIEAGMAEVVHKPVDFKLLRDVLDLHLYGARSGQAAESASRVDRRLESGSSSGNKVALNATILEDYVERMKTSANSRQDVVRTALSIVDAEVEKLIETIDSGDRKETSLRAHSLKGALALLGGRGILDLAKGLEIVASDETSAMRAEHWKTLILAAYEDFKTALTEHMRESERVS